MGKHIHKLYVFDGDNLTGKCTNCGPVSIVRMWNGNYLCANKWAERDHGLPRSPAWRALRERIRAGEPCEICGSPSEDADHCHETKIWRGPLCRRCNLGLGMFEDNVSIMRAAIRYVIKYRKMNHPS